MVGAKNLYIFNNVLYRNLYGSKKYSQTFYDNMTRKDKPKVVPCKSKSYTLIRYIPDFKKFNLDGLSDSMIKIMEKRAYDISTCATNANVFFNDKKLVNKAFNKYMDLYIEDKEQPKVCEKLNDRWEIGVTLNEDQVFESISFVNGINTLKVVNMLTILLIKLPKNGRIY